VPVRAVPRNARNSAASRNRLAAHRQRRALAFPGQRPPRVTIAEAFRGTRVTGRRAVPPRGTVPRNARNRETAEIEPPFTERQAAHPEAGYGGWRRRSVAAGATTRPGR